jgi:hypothetical protein
LTLALRQSAVSINLCQSTLYEDKKTNALFALTASRNDPAADARPDWFFWFARRVAIPYFVSLATALKRSIRPLQ